MNIHPNPALVTYVEQEILPRYATFDAAHQEDHVRTVIAQSLNLAQIINESAKYMNAEEMLHLMKERGIDEEHISLMRHCGIDLGAWLHGFDDTEAAVLETVDLVRNHPLMPKDVVVKGYIIETHTGEVREIIN